MTFLVGDVDYSDHVIAGSYNVNNEPQFNEWVDTNYTTHRQKLRDKVVGSFDMFFRTVEDYEEFKADLDEAQSSTNLSYSLSVTVNNTSEQKSINAFVKYSLVRNIDGGWNDYFERYTVNIEER